MTASSGAVFISHASQDAAAAARLCAALRAAGLEVWFDQSELRGGDAWDAAIRKQIKACVLFLPVISRNTHTRTEGYFRLEWKLAVDRSHLMADGRAFLVPVVIDDTPDDDEHVPDKFREVHWTRLPGGQTPREFTERIARLLTAPVSAASAPKPPPVASEPAGTAGKPALARLGQLLVAGLACLAAYLLADKLWLSRPAPAPTRSTPPAAVAPAVPSVADNSIAVLPFVNMSPDKDQDYFADGLAEQLLDLLAKTPGLHVIARTSSFSFKGKSDDIPTIASKLKVANILEGSVRKSGNHLRVTTQLVRASDGQHLWSETYDRELKDIFRVQDEIASAVVSALKLKLSPGQSATPSRSSNADAYVQYMLAQQYFNHGSEQDFRRSVGAYRQAIALDPQYAAAYAGLAIAEYYLADATGDGTGLDRARAAAQRAVELAPDQPMGYAARGNLRSSIGWDWEGAQADFTRALELDPNDAWVQRRYSILLSGLGRIEESIDAARRVTEQDPFSAAAWRTLGESLYDAGRLNLARAAIKRSLAIEPTNVLALTDLGTVELLDHRPADALTAFEQIPAEETESLGWRETGVAMAQHALGNGTKSQQALDLAIAKAGRVSAYQIAQAYSWRGEKDHAFEWLERAYRQRDGGLSQMKADPLLADLPNDPRYGVMLRKINLPE